MANEPTNQDIHNGEHWYGSWDVQQQEANQQKAEKMATTAAELGCGFSNTCDSILTGARATQGQVGWLEGAAIAAPIVPGVVGRWGDEAVTLFRAVSPAELDDIIQTGIFRPHPGQLSMDAKWFSETLDGAIEWGNRMFDEFEVVSVTIPKGVVDEMPLHKNMDGIANARYAIDEVLDQLNEAILDLIKVGE